MTLEPIDLMHMGLDRIIGFVDTPRGSRCSTAARLHDRCAESRARRARPRAQGIRHLLLSRPPTTRRCRRPSASPTSGARVADRRAIIGRRGSSTAPAGSTATFDVVWGALEPVPGRTSTPSRTAPPGSRPFPPRPRVAPSPISDRHAPGRRGGVRIVPGRYVFPAAPPGRRPRGWTQTFAQSRAAARPLRAHALRRRRCTEDTSPGCARAGEPPERVQSGMSQEGSKPRRAQMSSQAAKADTTYYERAGRSGRRISPEALLGKQPDGRGYDELDLLHGPPAVIRSGRVGGFCSSSPEAASSRRCPRRRSSP
jgi:hypothetical protein